METLTSRTAIDIIMERKSVRTFNGEPISRNDIETILHAAMAAPAAVRMLPWKFIVVRNREMLRRLQDFLPFAKMLLSAGTAIVVCAVPAEAPMSSEAFAIIDCSCASENILLAAEALGLGAVWTAVYPNKETMDFVRDALGIPPHVIPLNIIPIGHPAGDEKASDKYEPLNVHWEQW